MKIDLDAIAKKEISGPLSDCLGKGDDESMFLGTNKLLCPVCGFDYSHEGETQELFTDNYKAWNGRGSCLIIPFEGECGHNWDICIGYHKRSEFHLC